MALNKFSKLPLLTKSFSKTTTNSLSPSFIFCIKFILLSDLEY